MAQGETERRLASHIVDTHTQRTGAAAMWDIADAHNLEHNVTNKEVDIWTFQELSMDLADMQIHKANIATDSYYWVYNDKNLTDAAIAVSKKKFSAAVT